MKIKNKNNLGLSRWWGIDSWGCHKRGQGGNRIGCKFIEEKKYYRIIFIILLFNPLKIIDRGIWSFNF